MNALTLDIRAKRFGSAEVLGRIALALAPGERAALLGPSGIGKSTLLGVVAGLDRDFEGEVALPPGRLAMAFQTPRLLPWRTLAENLTIAAPDAGREAALDALRAVGLAAAADRHPEKVSLGMQRRAALARALIVRPTLLLMDEPLVSLDPATAAEMRALLTKTLDLTGAAALIATHDRREALALGDRVIELGGAPARLVRDAPSPVGRAQRLDPVEIETAMAAFFGSAGVRT